MARSNRSREPKVVRIARIPVLPARRQDANKGDFGRVLVIGGSVGMSGAPALAGMAALRSGAGLVTLVVPRSIQPIVATLCPCATSIGLPETTDGQIDPLRSLEVLSQRGLCGPSVSSPPDVLVMGMGIGRGDAAYGRGVWELIDAFRIDARVPAVIDADALNLARKGDEPAPEVWNRRPHPRTVITPHPGEMARLVGAVISEVQAHREVVARQTAETMAEGVSREDAPVVVLKGAGTIVTDGRRLYVNRTGNPGMATGGSGDVLAGIIGALTGQQLPLFDATVLGTHVHGRAGDLAARHKGQASLIATDLCDFLPAAFIATSSVHTRRTRS